MVSISSPIQIQNLKDASNRIRISSILQTNKANSGHPSSSASIAEIMATLFFSEMRYNVSDPKNYKADKFVLSKGHACPALYACWEEAGLLSHDQVLTLRDVNSDLEGHPTPRLNFIDVATGSLGQGLSCASGMAYTGKYLDKSSSRVYVVLGDGECAEGSVWEAASFSSFYKLDNLLAVVDVNRFGQSQETQLKHDLNAYANRFTAFGWHAISLDGHDVEALLRAYAEAKNVKDKPTVIIAKTFKGKGIDGIEDKDGYHGKPVSADKIKSIESLLQTKERNKWNITESANDAPSISLNIGNIKMSSPPNYKPDDKVATRQAYGKGLLKMAEANKRVIALDGDVSNSTFSCYVKEKLPEQYIECFIAEQNMVGIAIGAGCRDRAIPFCSTFGAFFTRAGDQIRMAAISFANVKFMGSHCGVSIGEDGPSQMALEDLALFRAIPDSVVLYPSDAVSMEYSVELAANYRGIVYIRASRPAVPIIYSNNEPFSIGKCKVLKQSPSDSVLLIGAGVTLNECLGAHEKLMAEGIGSTVIDLFSVKPLDTETIKMQAQRVGGKIVVVEEHYQAGGIGEAIALALIGLPGIHMEGLCVKELPRSGTPNGLLEMYGLSASRVVEAVKRLMA